MTKLKEERLAEPNGDYLPHPMKQKNPWQNNLF